LGEHPREKKLRNEGVVLGGAIALRKSPECDTICERPLRGSIAGKGDKWRVAWIRGGRT